MIDFEGMSKEEIKSIKLNWNQIIDYFINTPLLVGRELWVKKGGVPSGSYFTQLIDCILNMIALFYGLLHLSKRLCPHDPKLSRVLLHFNVLGDDSIMKLKKKLSIADVEWMLDIIEEATGFKSYVSKGFARLHHGKDDTPEYLGYEFTSQQGPTRPFLKTVEQILYPER